MIAAITKSTIVPHGNSERDSAERVVEQHGKPEPKRNPKCRAKQSRDHRLVPDHPARLPPRHADGSQHADLAGSLEDGQDSVFTIPNRLTMIERASRM